MNFEGNLQTLILFIFKMSEHQNLQNDIFLHPKCQIKSNIQRYIKSNTYNIGNIYNIGNTYNIGNIYK